MLEKCGATFRVGNTTFNCHLTYKHEGWHKCEYEADEAILTWKNDSRRECECGHRELDHAHYSGGVVQNSRCIYCGCYYYQVDRRPAK